MASLDASRLRLLREFADRGSVVAVAEALHLTPSAVSQQLRILQREAGVDLLLPAGRGLRLTPAGAALALAAVDVARALATAGATLADFRGGEAARVSVAMFPSGAELLLPEALTVLSERAPNVRLDSRLEEPPEAGFPALTADYDVVVGHTVSGLRASARPTGTTQLDLLTEPLDVAVRPDHPLAGRAGVTVADVADLPWVGVPEGFPFAQVLRDIGEAAGRRLDIVARFPDLRVIEALVAHGHGIGLVSRFTADASRLRLLPLTDLEPARHIVALTRPEVAELPAVTTVLTALQQAGRALAERSR